MRFCKNCDRAMVRDPSTGVVVFRCPCGTAEQGTPEDARVGGSVLGAGETTEMYRRLIQTAPFDRTNQLISRTCRNCGLDYMTQIRVGDAEVIIYKCKCGHEEVGGETQAAAATATAAAQKSSEK